MTATISELSLINRSDTNQPCWTSNNPNHLWWPLSLRLTPCTIASVFITFSESVKPSADKWIMVMKINVMHRVHWTFILIQMIKSNLAYYRRCWILLVTNHSLGSDKSRVFQHNSKLCFWISDIHAACRVYTMQKVVQVVVQDIYFIAKYVWPWQEKI